MARLVWFAFMAAISVVVTVAQGASPSEECISVLMDMSDCLSFVENGSTVPRPSTSCCNGFKKVLKNSPQCLCDAFYNQNGLPIAIDMKKAMSLPAACKATGSIPCTSKDMLSFPFHIVLLLPSVRDLLKFILICFLSVFFYTAHLLKFTCWKNFILLYHLWDLLKFILIGFIWFSFFICWSLYVGKKKFLLIGFIRWSLYVKKMMAH